LVVAVVLSSARFPRRVVGERERDGVWRRARAERACRHHALRQLVREVVDARVAAVERVGEDAVSGEVGALLGPVAEHVEHPLLPARGRDPGALA
jgi:hypothetical protein